MIGRKIWVQPLKLQLDHSCTISSSASVIQRCIVARGRFMCAAISSKESIEGDIPATEMALKIIEKRCRLLNPPAAPRSVNIEKGMALRQRADHSSHG